MNNTETPELGDIKAGHRGTQRGRWMWCACVDCGKERWVRLTGIKINQERPLNKRCNVCGGKTRPSGDKSSQWKGGKIKTPAGYVVIKVNTGEFFSTMADSKGYIPEHRLVMAKSLGRNLHSWDVVHHKNGIRDDNRLENLELTTKGAHTIAHNKGYQDGYTKGLVDGRDKQFGEIKSQNDELLKQIKLLQWQIKEYQDVTIH